MLKTKETKYYLLISIIVSIFVFIIFILAGLLNNFISNSTLKILILYLSSFLVSFVIVFGFSIFSTTISDMMITLRRRLRFESLSNPLLLRLSYEAPGTYHHSLNVSNLAQRACKEIGADSLLARLAGYYHDIGKLREPNKFIENQSQNEIPQDESAGTIKTGAKTIISHVKSGIEIAKENNLPEDVIDIISEHHGTTRAEYFFEKAKEKGIKIKYTDFRYPGPVPQSKESAILMLSDCVEAITRTKDYISEDIISNIVSNTIENRLEEGQLKNANLTDSEMAKIRYSLIKTLLSIYHQRISYEK